ncbi:lipoprotein, partial [Arthrobacter crystallopoietes BAB-32]
LAAAALGLTACGGDAQGGQASPAASPAASTQVQTATPMPTATPSYKPASADGPAENVPLPKMPEKAKEESKEGLEEFVKYWYATLSYAYETGDMEPLKQISGKGCKGCLRVEQTISEWHTDGKWIVGGELSVVGSVIERFEASADGTYQVLTQVDQQKLGFYSSTGSLEHEVKKEIGIIDVMNAEYADGQWRAKNVEGMG